MKAGTHASDDHRQVRAAREAIGVRDDAGRAVQGRGG